jgi:TetR/AcrR family transcriptional regulator, cholesterol catabolism regulator
LSINLGNFELSKSFRSFVKNFIALETKSKIIQTAADLFMHLGIRSVTMDDIARQAGVSKKTIYQEFSDKNQLVFETFSKALEEDICQLQGSPQVNEGVIEHLIGLSHYMRKRFGEMNPFVMNEIQRYYPQCWKLFEDFKQSHVYQEIVQLLEKGKEEGFFRPDLNTEIIALMRMEQMTLIFDPLKFPPSKYNLLEFQMEIFEHFLYGIFTEKGREAYITQKNSPK